MTARSLGECHLIDGDYLERAYKLHLSGYQEWDQLGHAGSWMLKPENVGERLSIDETSLHDDLFTFLSNKAGHCRRGSIVAAVRGTKAEDVVSVLTRIPEEDRLAVKEVTLDMSSSMRDIVSTAFPNAVIVLDCFHVLKRCHDAVEELRLRTKREAQADARRQEREFRERRKRNAAHRRRYRKAHPKSYPGKVRGPKPRRRNERFRPPVLGSGDTAVELLTRTKRSLAQSPDKWSEKQRERMRLLFDMYPKIKEAYWTVNRLRSIFRNKALDRDSARPELREWYKAVSGCTSRELKSARDAIKSREDEVLNYFINRSTNAGAESLNSKIKAFRAQLRGVADLPFFMFRLSKIFG